MGRVRAGGRAPGGAVTAVTAVTAGAPRRRGLAPADVMAGLSVALVLIPQALAYAELAGFPAYRGLYAAALPAVVAAVFASSPYLQTGPTAVTCLLTFGALSTLEPPRSDGYVELGLLLALIVGAVRVLVGLSGAGVLAYLISEPILLGFVPAAAILIAASQLPAALGAAAEPEGVLPAAAWTLAHPGSWEPTSVVLAAMTIALVLGGRRVHALFPGVLIAVAVGVVYSLALDYEGPEIGRFSAALPPLSLDLPWGAAPQLLLPGAIIALVGFAEPASIARTFASRERRPWNASREFVSQGAANLTAAVSGGFPVGGSFSRSALNHLAGAQTRWSGAVTGLVVLAFLPFASTLLSPLPTAVLGALVIAAAIGLVRLAPAVRLWGYSKPQFAVAWITFALTLALSPHIERAIMAGIVLSVAIHLWRELRLGVETTTDGGTLHVKPLGVLWFGSASAMEEAFLRLLAEHPEATRLEIHLDGLGRLDLTGALALRAVLDDAREAGLEVQLADVPVAAQPLVARVFGDRDPRPAAG
jgi:SulP family sulfate permease